MKTLAMRAVVVAVAGALGAGLQDAGADSLSDRIRDSVPPTAIQGPPQIPIDAVRGASNAITSVVADALQRVAIRGVDFPVVATVPGYSYVYNPTLQTFERSTQLGPVFSERAETVGRGRFEIGLSYLFANLDEVDGDDLGLYTGTSVLPAETIPGVTAFLDSEIDFREFSIEHQWFNASFTYGITDRWDVNVLLPVVQTDLTMRGRQRYVVRVLDPDTGALPAIARTGERTIRAEGDRFGVGDLLARTKYRFFEGPVNLAAVVSLRFPTGDEEDFQGLGDTTITPSMVAAAALGAGVSVYGNFGFEVNADDAERNRARYAVGASYQVIEQLALLLDIVGSSAFVDDEFEVAAPPRSGLVRNPDGSEPNGLDFPQGADIDTFAIPRSDIVDLAVGAKLSVAPGATAFIGAIVPITDDGLRADVIPTGGIEVTF
jgi:hypothetical protein